MQDSLKILEAVNTFYTQSFSQLITITIAVLVFAGAVLPILITLYQQRLFKLEHQSIEQKMQEKLKLEISSAIAKVKNEYEAKEKEYENKIEVIKKELQEEVANAQGGIFHVQGNNELKQSLYDNATHSFIDASKFYLDSNDNQNLRRTLNQLIDYCLPMITKESFSNNEELSTGLEELIESLREYSKHGNYSDLINELVNSHSKAKIRKPERAVEK